MGDYKAALSRYDAVNLEKLTVHDISSRRLQLIGEAFAVKGNKYIVIDNLQLLRDCDYNATILFPFKLASSLTKNNQ